jgi:hypothetical protein
MTTNARASRPPSRAGYVFGGLSFIPGLGIIFGIVAIVIGATKRDNKVAFLGVGGIALSVVLYSALFYFGFVATFGPYAALKVKLAEQLIRTDAGQIALYKLQHGRLPATLAEIPRDFNGSFMPFDPWFKPLAYKVNPNGTFELRSAGPDGKFNTADDIVQTY